VTPTPDPAAVQAHRDSLTRLSGPDGPLRAGASTATTSNPAWFRTVGGRPQPKAARLRTHADILDAFRQERPDVAAGRRAVVLAGPPGAGKSTVLPSILRATGIPEQQWRTIDADSFKDRLLDQALHDGSYEQFVVPSEVRDLQAGGERFYPLELASLVHEESSLLARQARVDAIRAGENVVIDTVLSGAENAAEIGRQLHAAGYRVTLVEVEVAREESIARTQARWRSGYVAAEEGVGSSRGGRWVPETLPASLYDAGTTDSVCRAVARGLARSERVVTEYQEHRVDSGTGTPVLERTYARDHVGGSLVRASAAGVSSYPTPAATSLRNAPRAQGRERPDDLIR
jgi:chloramphenicol 3-O-phosphotransferase